MQYLIAYDISNDKARSKFSKHLRQLGMKRVQKSVFVGKIKKQEQYNIYQKLLLKIDTLTDRLIFMPFSVDIAKEMQVHSAINDITQLTQTVGVSIF